ncbi:hypothetical protein [Desulfosporosinus sp. SB140]|uniref:hypothetical protein n=1 Tax=Desulfosporosinus paludis TaxID=3115649 RepID=UPI00388EE6FD
MKTWEVLKLALENRSIKVKRLSHGDICYIDDQGQIKIVDRHGQYPLIKVDEEWELVREPVDFMTAINSGKLIRSELWNRYDHHACNFPRQPIDTSCDIFQLGKKEINGKWYIEDDTI